MRSMNGVLAAFQFFTTFPIKKELPLGRKEVTQLYMALPFVGATIGLSMYAVMEIFISFLGVGSLLTAVLIVLTGIVVTGGLHMDGWADTADAFFSYKDREKRLDILNDPRLGAFGTIAIVLLIIFKIALFNELLIQGNGHMLWFVLVPLLARATMTIYFTALAPAKEVGIVAFFKKKMVGKQIFIFNVTLVLLILIILCIYLGTFVLPISLLFVMSIIIILSYKWSMKHFGGVSGDLCGAFIEGMEAVLWLVVFVLL